MRVAIPYSSKILFDHLARYLFPMFNYLTYVTRKRDAREQ